MTLPVAKAYKEAGYFVEYLVLAGYAEIIEACPYVDVVHKCYKFNRRARLADPATNGYLNKMGIVTEGVTKVVDFWCPAWQHERATAGNPYRNRIESFWISAGLKIENIPPAPLYGLIQIDLKPLPSIEGKDFAIFQLKTQDTVRDVPQKLYQPKLDYCESNNIITCGLSNKHTVNDYTSKLLTRLPFNQLCWAVKNALFMCCGDSGPLHLAAAFGTPTFAWFGPTQANLICKRYPSVTYYQGKGCTPCYYQKEGGWDDCRKKGYCRALTD